MIAPPVVSFQARRVARLSRPAEAYDRSLRLRVGLAWGLVFLNVLTFYKGTWNGLPLIVPIPSKVGQFITQGSLPAAVLVAWSANRRMLIRPNVFLSLLTLLLIEALISGIQPTGHIIGTLYRTVRLGEFVAVLWLLSPWFDRRDLLLVRCQLKSLGVVLGSVLLGLMVSPHRALAGGRLSGEFWPITPVQVADFAAVALGLVVVLWFCGKLPGWRTLAAVAVLGIMLILTHTRTEVVALMAGLLVAGLSMFAAKARVRRLFASVGLTVSVDDHRILQRADDLAGPRAELAGTDGLFRPDNDLGYRTQHSTRLVPGALGLRPVQQFVQRPSHRRQLARRLPGPRPGRGDPLCGVALVRPGECVLPAAQ